MWVCSLSNKDNTSILLKQKKDNRCNIYAKMHDASKWEGDSCERVDSKQDKNPSSLEQTVCYLDDRYRIEVQIPSLFQDRTASRVRIVNGVDKYVTESMLTKEEEDIASGNPLLKQDHDKSQQ